jgi:hypothetical protein
VLVFAFRISSAFFFSFFSRLSSSTFVLSVCLCVCALFHSVYFLFFFYFFFIYFFSVTTSGFDHACFFDGYVLYL